VNATDIAAGLGARKFGTVFVGTCPSCGYKGALSLTERDGRTLVHCFVGCDQGTLLAVLRAKGLWTAERDSGLFSPPRPPVRNGDAAEHTARARALWRRSQPAEGTPVETYLRVRGLTGPMPKTVRHLPDARHGPTGLVFPAMICAVTRWPSGEVIAVHRTFLTADGRKAPVEPQKMTLGPTAGAAVRLAAAGPALAVAEGIETALSAQEATGLPTWAALSAGGIENLVLPPSPYALEITIFADNDASGRGKQAADKAAARWHAEGRRVWTALPPSPGTDFNDVLRAADAAGGVA
jgi:phage/plasmid primase-like uncharacterized protein